MTNFTINKVKCTYLQIKTIISTAAILESNAFTEEHWPFFSAGRLMTSKHTLFAIKPIIETDVRDIPWTTNSKYADCKASWISEDKSVRLLLISDDLFAIFEVNSKSLCSIFIRVKNGSKIHNAKRGYYNEIFDYIIAIITNNQKVLFH